MLSRTIFALLLITLTACGGSGTDGDTSTPPAETSASDSSTSTNGDGETSSPPATLAAHINVPEGFDFAASKLVTVDVQLENQSVGETYLTVCRVSSVGKPDYDECLVRTPVKNGLYQGELQVSNDIESLIATLWSFNPAEVINTYTWVREENGQLPIKIGN